MAILNYTTSISAEKTIGEIEKLLVKKGVVKFVCDYQDMIPSAVTFALMMGDRMTYFSMPANYDGVFRAMQKDRDVPSSYCTRAQAIRVAWRIIKVWIQAQLVIIEAGQAELPEIFLPYAITSAGNTLYKQIKEDPKFLIS